MSKYGIYIQSEPYYGMDASWEQYTNGGDEPSREQVIKCMLERIDYLSKFIKPSVLLDFSKALEDTLTGDEMYSNLCENLGYVHSLGEKAFGISREFYVMFSTEVFGESIPYNTENDCHLMPFPKSEMDGNLSRLLSNPKSFNEWFLRMLSRNNTLYSVLIDGANCNNVIKADVFPKLKMGINSLLYHKRQIEETKKSMEAELSRIDESFELSDEEREIAKEATELIKKEPK